MIELHRDRRQALRIRRALLGVVAYLMWMAVGLYLYSQGLIRVGLGWLLGYFGLMLLTNAAFIFAIRRDWNLRFQDPGMTLGQIACGIFWGMVLLSQAYPEARGGMLLVFVTSFFFGVFRLTTRQFLLLTLFASLAYASLIRLEWESLDAATRQTEVAQWVFLSLVLLWMSFMGGYVARLRANLRNAMRRIEELANRDHLTGTRNRRSIAGSLDAAMAHATAEGTPLSVAMLDLDGFKKLNDDYGHLAGDEVLRELVKRVDACLRSDDFIGDSGGGPLGRFGGEEFLVVLPGTELQGARQAAERMREAVCNTKIETKSGSVHVTISIGVATHRQGDDAEILLRRADRALYKAKENGRDRVETE